LKINFLIKIKGEDIMATNLQGILKSSKNNKEITRSGSDWVEATLQSDKVSVVVQLGSDGQTLLSLYRMYGKNNRGELIKEIIFDNDGNPKNIYEGEK
jgi:hypothetical protein